jgi:hypothetical protein
MYRAQLLEQRIIIAVIKHAWGRLLAEEAFIKLSHRNSL